MKTNAIIVKRLCLTWIVSFLISLFIEFVPEGCMISAFPFISEHKNYIVSLSLGVLTGAFIGVITAYIQYSNYKIEETGKLILKLIKITNEILSYDPQIKDDLEKAKKIIAFIDLDTTELGAIVSNMQFIYDPFGRKQQCIYNAFYKQFIEFQNFLADNSKFLQCYVKGVCDDQIPGIRANLNECENYFLEFSEDTIQNQDNPISYKTFKHKFAKTTLDNIADTLYPLGYTERLTKKIKKKIAEKNFGN